MIAALKRIVDSPDPIGSVVMRKEISPGLLLQKETTPLGVLLAIFESRTDAIPQVVALAIKSGRSHSLVLPLRDYHFHCSLR